MSTIDGCSISIGLILATALGVLANEPTTLSRAKEVVRVACIGDSITFGHTIPDREHKSYPAQLAKLLGSDIDVRNFGVNGATALKHDTRPYADQQAFRDALAFKPQFVVIMLGTNDTNKKSWADYYEHFASDYLAIIKEFHTANPAAHFWLCTPPPLFRDRGATWDTDLILKEQIVPKINEIAREQRCNIIDGYTLFGDKSAFFADGVHPNSAGAEILARAIARELAPRLAHNPGSK
jgi:sialate O-acetylesterase